MRLFGRLESLSSAGGWTCQDLTDLKTQQRSDNFEMMRGRNVLPGFVSVHGKEKGWVSVM